MDVVGVDFETALEHIAQLPIINSTADALTHLQKRMSIGSWIGLGITNLGLDIFGGLFAYQEGCVAITVIPGINVFSGAMCVIALVASMIFVAGSSGLAVGAGEGIIGAFGSSGIEKSSKRLMRRDGTYIDFDSDFYKYGHHANLTHYHMQWRSNGLMTDLLDTDDAVYYLLGGSMFGTNVTNVYETYSGHNLYVQHGLNASRSYAPYYAVQSNITKRDWEPVGTVDEYGNGFDDEELQGTQGFKGQWCHSFGDRETISPVYDWSTMNGLINDVTGSGATDRYNLWTFDVVDMNHGEAQVCDIEIEGESNGFGSNVSGVRRHCVMLLRPVKSDQLLLKSEGCNENRTFLKKIKKKKKINLKIQIETNKKKYKKQRKKIYIHYFM